MVGGDVQRIERAYETAASSMARLNRCGARLMRTHGAHACTDVTGFGLLGHAANLAKEQTQRVAITIDTLPVIRDTLLLDKVGGYGLDMGISAETSGGLLVCLPSEDAARRFCEDIEREDGVPSWIVGKVIARSGDDEQPATLADEPKIIEF